MHDMTTGHQAEIITLSDVRQTLQTRKSVRAFFSLLDPTPVINLCTLYQKAVMAITNQCFSNFYKATQIQADRRMPTFHIDDLVERSGFTPIRDMARIDGEYLVARYTLPSACAVQNVLQPLRMELKITVTKDGQEITIYHGDTKGNGHGLLLRRDDPEAYRLYSYNLLEQGRVRQRLSPDRDGVYKMLGGIIPAINIQRQQERSRAAYEQAHTGARSAAISENIRLVI